MRVGIVTFYNGNINYGGILQAYALQKTIEKLGYDSRQICLDNTITDKLSFSDKVSLVLKLKGRAFDIYKRKKEQKEKEEAIKDIRIQQAKSFKKFQDSIPHTEKSYKSNELAELDGLFDIFVCGSDQIWTPVSGGFRPVPHRWSYYLEFTDKKKISYAASFGADSLSESFQKEVLPKIESLDAVSVREKNAKRIIEGKISKKVEVVVDPVLLITKEKWDELAVAPVEKDYVFSYILGKSNGSREFAADVAEVLGKQLITVPFIGDYNKMDFNFGDIQKNGISPEEFLGYIKNADYIVTDSFHCAVFAIIFEKQFAVLKRSDDKSKGAMNSRLTDLMELLGISDRVADGRKKIIELINTDISYKNVSARLDIEREKSLCWLRDHL